MKISSSEIDGKLLGINNACESWIWWAFFLPCLFGSLIFLCAILYLFYFGVGIWGINQPVSWGFAIVNFVWWIGIGHAGTLISAFLLLTRQKWRSSINRSAEAMTLIAIACAGLFPIFHLGRPMLFYWLFPYRSEMGLWPQYRSSLVWDVMAILTYALLSLCFWYLGLLPDLMSKAQHSKKSTAHVWRILSLGWKGHISQWRVLQQTSLILAGLATVLVVSVHSVVSLDFSIGIVPGWHSTLFPPYFVAGAIYSGLGMVVTLLVPMRHFLNLEEYITTYHFECIRKLTIAAGLIVAYGYMSEHFYSWYSNNEAEIRLLHERQTGFYATEYWLMLILNVGIPLLLSFFLWGKRPWLFFFMSIGINIGMWMERYIIVVSSLSTDFLKSSWHSFIPTIWDWIFLFGSLSFFFAIFLLFLRFLPPVSVWEVKESMSG